jgi:riboflavin synthase
MFTGLIQEVGTVVGLRTNKKGNRLEITAPMLAGKAGVGDSVAINGCCLTVASREGDQLEFDVLQESLARTNLRNLQPEDSVNLELALTAGAHLGGHFVQGHVDGAAPIRALDQKGADLRLEIELPSEFAHYVVCKGSIAVDGISLTVAEVLPKSFAVWIVPHTRTQTNLPKAKIGHLVNLEFDLLAKYVERMLDRRGRGPT